MPKEFNEGKTAFPTHAAEQTQAKKVNTEPHTLYKNYPKVGFKLKM